MKKIHLVLVPAVLGSHVILKSRFNISFDHISSTPHDPAAAGRRRAADGLSVNAVARIELGMQPLELA